MAKKKRILWQLYPSYLVIMLVSLIAVTWFASTSLKQFFLRETESDLEARAYLFEKQILDYLDPLNRKRIDQLCKNIGELASTRITVILPNGKVIGDSDENPEKMDNHLDRQEVIRALKGPSGASTRHSLTLAKNMMYVAVPLKKDTRTVALVRTAVPVDAIDKAIKNIRIKIAIGGIIIALFGAILSFLISRRISRPIEEMKEGAERFAGGDLGHRLLPQGSEEMQGLAESLNQMARQLGDRIKTVIRQRNELEAVLTGMIEGVIAVDTEERIIRLNQAAARIFECSASEAEGRSIQEIARSTALQGFVKEALTSAVLIERDINLYSDDDRILKGHGTRLYDEAGKQMGALIVLHDVTRLRKLENIRRDFVANVSHEIKTPVTAIKGFVETLQEGAVENPEERSRFLGIINKHVDRLEALIEDLLSLSRIEQEVEKDEIVLHEAPVRDVLLTAIHVCEVKAAPKRIHLELSCNEFLKANINTQLLEQAVVNLLDNAIKYSGEDSVVRTAARQIDDEIEIQVRDEGCGIEKKHLPRLFERFYRVDKSRSRSMGGTGLGLAIVKHIVQAHHGRITVESAPGQGSTFTIRIPKGMNGIIPDERNEIGIKGV